jgi:hypothetical protein
LAPKSYVDAVAAGGGGLSLASILEYENDETANVLLDSHIPNKAYVDLAVANAGAGFDTANAPLLRYGSGIDSLLVGSDN